MGRDILARRVAFARLLRSTALLSVLVVAPVASQVRDAQAPPRIATAADGYAPVYVVTAQDTHDRALSSLASRTTRHVDALGQRVVVADLREHQLADFSRHVHEKEHRCGGYFAFDTRAEAERFVRGRAGVRGATAQFLPEYTIDNQAVVGRWQRQVREAGIRDTILHLSTAYPNRYYASTHGRDAALWIRDTWLGLARGRSDVTAELFEACGNCGTQPSVILTIHGNELADEVVVLGGHLDSISSTGGGNAMNAPGADDDASGIATLTEVLGVMMRNRYRPQRTIKFMAYAAEEVGLRGSRAIAQDFAAQGVDVVGVLQMDMTNFRSPASETDIRVMTDNSNVVLVDFLRDLFATYMAPAGYTISDSSCGYACSDHASWTQNGFPAAMYDEGPFFPLLHTPNDRLENMGGDAQHATIIAKLGLAFAGELGKNSATPRDRLMPPGGPAPRPGDGPRRRL